MDSVETGADVETGDVDDDDVDDDDVDYDADVDVDGADDDVADDDVDDAVETGAETGAVETGAVDDDAVDYHDAVDYDSDFFRLMSMTTQEIVLEAFYRRYVSSLIHTGVICCICRDEYVVGDAVSIFTQGCRSHCMHRGCYEQMRDTGRVSCPLCSAQIRAYCNVIIPDYLPREVTQIHQDHLTSFLNGEVGDVDGIEVVVVDSNSLSKSGIGMLMEVMAWSFPTCGTGIVILGLFCFIR